MMLRRSPFAVLLLIASLVLAACGDQGTGQTDASPAPQASPPAAGSPSPEASPEDTGAPSPEASPEDSASPAPEASPGSTDYGSTEELIAGADLSQTITEIPINEDLAGAGDISLDVWLAADYYETEPVQNVINSFREAYPNITINLTGYEWGDMQNQVKLAVGTGTAPCVSHGHPYAMGAQGFAEDITDLWNEWGQADKFMDSAIMDVTWQDRVYGVPLDINTLFTIYNKELFQQAGVPEPTADWTFQDARAAAEQLTEGDVYGTVISASGWAMSGMVVANGANLITEENGQITANLDDPKVIEVVDLIAKLGQDGLSPIPPQTPRQTDAPVAIFGAGKAAFFFSGPWDIARIRNEGQAGLIDKVGTAPLPNGMTGETDGSVLGGGSLWIPAGCQNKEAAFELLKWFTTNEYQMNMVADQARYPVIAELYNTDFLQSDELAQPFYEQLETAQPYALEPYADASKAWTDAVRATIDGASAQEQLTQAQSTAQQAIEQAQ